MPDNRTVIGQWTTGGPDRTALTVPGPGDHITAAAQPARSTTVRRWNRSKTRSSATSTGRSTKPPAGMPATRVSTTSLTRCRPPPSGYRTTKTRPCGVRRRCRRRPVRRPARLPDHERLARLAKAAELVGMDHAHAFRGHRRHPASSGRGSPVAAQRCLTASGALEEELVGRVEDGEAAVMLSGRAVDAHSGADFDAGDLGSAEEDGRHGA